MEKNVAFTPISFAVLKWDVCLSVTGSDQRVIRREPKIECYVLTKVKSLPFFQSFYNDLYSFDTYLYIFHRTEDQMVILRCWTGLNQNWFKSYDTKRKWGNKESGSNQEWKWCRAYGSSHNIRIFYLINWKGRKLYRIIK